LAADGSRSLGLRMKVLPVAIAIGCIHSGTIAGKLNGVMPATTPSGCRKLCTSMPRDTWSEKLPLRMSPRPHAYSTTSRPRAISPRASLTVLPCSAEMIRPSSSSWRASSSRKENITWVRCDSDDSDQVSKARAAAATAVSTSALSASRTRACSSPVAGLNTGAVRVAAPAVRLPLIQCSIVFT
jgi:hypothetical protein